MFGPDDRRSTLDFYPGEYQRTHVMVRNGSDKLRPQTIVDGLRSGNAYATTGQLIDRLAFVMCADYPPVPRSRARAAKVNAAIEELAIAAAKANTDVDEPDCVNMGEKLVVNPGADIVVSIVVRDPPGKNYSPYSFDNPSLLQVGIKQPLDMPVLDHVDVIAGMVTGYKQPNTPDYSGMWPNDWIEKPNLANVPAGARNLSAQLTRTFNASTWRAVPGSPEYKAMTFRSIGITRSQYVRLRGTNLPPSVPFETDASGNPVPDLWTNPTAVNPSTPGGNNGQPENYYLKIKCTATGTNVPSNSATYPGTNIDGCPNHLPVIGGVKYSAYDVAGWADLWFYSNPIYVEVKGSVPVAGVK
jgi:hypothetical protein